MLSDNGVVCFLQAEREEVVSLRSFEHDMLETHLLMLFCCHFRWLMFRLLSLLHPKGQLQVRQGNLLLLFVDLHGERLLRVHLPQECKPLLKMDLPPFPDDLHEASRRLLKADLLWQPDHLHEESRRLLLEVLNRLPR